MRPSSTSVSACTLWRSTIWSSPSGSPTHARSTPASSGTFATIRRAAACRSNKARMSAYSASSSPNTSSMPRPRWRCTTSLIATPEFLAPYGHNVASDAELPSPCGDISIWRYPFGHLHRGLPGSVGGRARSRPPATGGPPMSMLAVRDLRVRYRRAIVAVRNISLDVPTGAVVAVLGSNGAGKTTLLRAISGILTEYGGAVERGTITFEGRPLTARSAAAAVAAGVVQAPEGRRIFERLTVAENLRIGGFSVRDKAARQRARALVHELFPILHERRGQRAGLLSGGQQQMLAIGRALMAGPRLLLLDEPSLGLAPVTVQQVFATLRGLNEAGLTMVLVEQNAKLALQSTHRAYVIEQGRIVHSGASS